MSDWNKQIYFEDVQVGDTVSPVIMNLTVERLIEWAAAKREFHPIHHNDRYAQKEGAPAMYVGNGVVQGWWERTVQEYIGLDGRIKKVGPFRIRMFSIPGDAVVTEGTVKKKWQENGQNFVELEIVSRHQRGISAGPGPVVASLPSRAVMT